MAELTFNGPECAPETASGELPMTTTAQADLFDGEADFGRELLTIEEDRKANRHTGTTLERRIELRDQICERLVSGVSVRAVCRLYRVGRNTVTELKRRLEAAGKMEPYKKRMSAKFAEVIEMGTDLLLERIEDGAVPTQVLPVMVGIFADKRALLEGEPTTILARVGAGELTQEGWDRWLDGLPRAKEVAAPVDVQSTESEAKPQ